MTPEERKQYRAIGGRLAVVLRQRQGQLPSPAAMQGIAADLVGDKTELLLPLKDLVSRPGFQSLISQAGSGRGTVERQALLAELEATFASTVIRAMGELLGGFLDLPATAAQVPVGNEARVNRAANSPDRPAPATPAAPTPPPTSAGGTTPSERMPERHGHGIARAIRWLALATLSGVVTVAAVLAVRSPALCLAFGLCRPAVTSATQQSLTAASRAALELDVATSLESFSNAAEVLGKELLKLSGDPLTPEQKTEVERLSAFYQRAQASVADEVAAQERLDRAREAITAAARLTGAEQQNQIVQAREALEEIPGRSFASEQARQLTQELERLAAQAEAEAKERLETLPSFPSNPVTPSPPPLRAPSQDSSGSSQAEGWRGKPLF